MKNKRSNVGEKPSVSKSSPFLFVVPERRCVCFLPMVNYKNHVKIVVIFFKDFQESVFEKHLSSNWGERGGGGRGGGGASGWWVFKSAEEEEEERGISSPWSVSAESKKSFLGIKKKKPREHKEDGSLGGKRREKHTPTLPLVKHSGDETVRVDVITVERNGISSTLNWGQERSKRSFSWREKKEKKHVKWRQQPTCYHTVFNNSVAATRGLHVHATAVQCLLSVCATHKRLPSKSQAILLCLSATGRRG